MKSHVRENIVKNTLMNSIRLIPNEDNTSKAELSGLAWEIVLAMAGNVNISNVVYYHDTGEWQVDGEYLGKKATCKDMSLSVAVIAVRDKLKGTSNE